MSSNPLKWHGGKGYLAGWIISLMPAYVHYVEPYFGGGAVLFRKSPEGVSEVVNDLNGELMNFWNVLQDRLLFDRFQRLVEATPFSEVEFRAADPSSYHYETEMPDESTIASLGFNDDERLGAALDFFIRYRQSRQGLGKDFATLSRNRVRRGMNEQVSSWLSAVEGLPDAHGRLKRVVILNRDALDVIKSQDGPNTLFYLDPPYLHETRQTTSDYEFEMSAEEHLKLLRVLSEINGKFLLSGYHSHTYDSTAQQFGWMCHEKEIDNKASSKKVKDRKTECVWANFTI